MNHTHGIIKKPAARVGVCESIFFGSDHRWGDVPPAECGDQWNQWMIHGFFLRKIGHRKRRKAMAFDIVLTIMMMGVSGFNFPMNDLMPGYSKHFNTRIAIGIV